ncbi:sigma-54-dependent transcriptional regulator [Oceanicella actignis]|uniref:sigma-54-dependent transcriptional regulator n=1 Tax=Oceanicella actignis TaxID=1189325 RepID=UPI0011E7A6F6|nr:sigma-54 dependent transcriptional regulator [Oceanicella actignis]TYO91626.1 two-component system nitrogen regulation response regulator GlnG [Oceanicella actignis]
MKADSTRGQAAPVLIADADPAVRRYLRAVLETDGRRVEEASDLAAALRRLSAAPRPRLALADMDLDGGGALALLSRLPPGAPPVVVLSVDPAPARIVRAARAGARDVLIKPVDPAALRAAVGAHAERRAAAPAAAGGLDALIAVSPAARAAADLARRFARSDAPLLIEGESGAGKEAFARAIHAEGPRRDGPFVAFDCAAMPPDLAEAALFGRAGADVSLAGKFEEAEGGVLFLDGVCDLPARAQARLARIVATGRIARLGAGPPRRVNARLISAADRPLSDEAAAGRFRQELFLGLSALCLRVPPLRARREDIAPLAELFARRAAEAESVAPPRPTPEALAALEAHDWPGNLRELENVMRRLAVLHPSEAVEAEAARAALRARPTQGAGQGPACAGAEARGAPAQACDAARLRVDGRGAEGARGGGRSAPAGGFFDAEGEIRPIWEIEAAAIAAALSRYGGDVALASRKLGMGRATLYRKMRDHGLTSR